MVVKRAFLDEAVEGGRTLRKEVCTEFAQDNCGDNVDFTAMKASWLSKIDPRKETGSPVIWVKNKLAADCLLRTGQALFGGGAYGAFCSRYEPSTADKLCFNCNAYGHLRGACRRLARCGKCSGAHQTWDCQSQDPPSVRYGLDSIEARVDSAGAIRTIKGIWWPRRDSLPKTGR